MIDEFKSKVFGIIDRQPLKYLFAGGAAFIFEYLSFITLLYVLGINAPLSSGFSFIFGLIVSYVLQRNWVFKNHANENQLFGKDLLGYGFLALFNLFATTYGVKVLSDMNVEPYVGKLILVLLIMLWNFVIYKRVLFKS